MRLALVCTIFLLSGAFARSAELYYLDRDAFNNEYVGPVGPLVLSGEIAPGDYDRLLAKIAEDDNASCRRTSSFWPRTRAMPPRP